MTQINEGLQAGDLRMLVDNIFEVDSFASKMGEDKEIVVLAFTVKSQDPAQDLVEFIENGYDFVLDADASPGELSDGKYKVFVEIERNRRIAEQILELLNGISKLADIDDFKFRYHKSFHSIDADKDNLDTSIPKTKDEYEVSIQESTMNNFSNFFGRSFLEAVSVDHEDIVFQKKYAEPLRMRIADFGTKTEVYDNIVGPIMLEGSSMSEIMYFTKYVGNYNITKVGDKFVFENGKYAVALEKV
jgi:hypothetical protein